MEPDAEIPVVARRAYEVEGRRALVVEPPAALVRTPRKEEAGSVLRVVRRDEFEWPEWSQVPRFEVRGVVMLDPGREDEVHLVVAPA
jgi:hypothetical protein